ncbi:MAG: YesL family protein [Oscillospiraceae bacterium]|nr:YesL family protein [Oscillospiraceae bacterium]
MGLFGNGYNRPGPGVSKDQPDKKGIMRFFEVFGRDAGELIKANFMFLICGLPTLAAVALYFMMPSIIFILLIAVTCVLTGPALCAMNYVIIKMARNQPGYIGHDFKKSFKENFKQGAIAGLILGTGWCMLIFSGYIYLTNMFAGKFSLFLVFYLFAAFLLGGITCFVPAQIATVELGLGDIFKNSILLTFGFLPRSLPAILVSGALVAVQAMYFPISVIVIPFFGFSLPCLIAILIVWPVMKKVFVEQSHLDAFKEDDDENNTKE